MLELMRKHARSWLMKILLGIVILVFIFYFGSMAGKQKAETIATINKKPISYIDYYREYQNLLDFYRQRYGGTLTEDIIREMNLKQQAYDNTINQAVILQRAEDLKIKVMDEEVKSFILSIPTFQRGGVFDNQLYNQFLRYYKMTPADFELSQKKGLTIRAFENLLTQPIKVSEKELFDFFRFQNEKINISFLNISVKDFSSKVVFDRNQLEAYLKEHESDFRVPDKIKVKYISFRSTDFIASVRVSDEEVYGYYQRQKDKFLKKDGKPAHLSDVRNKIIEELKHTRAMHIAAEEAKKAREMIYQMENFDEYAKQNGLKVFTTDFFDAKNPPQEFKDVNAFTKAAFELQADETSPVLSDSKGYYIIKLLAKKPSYTPALQEIEDKVKKRYAYDQALILSKNEAESILERLKSGVSIEKISQEKGLKVAETGFFLPSTSVPKIGSSKELNSAIFRISENNPYPDNPYFINESFVIVKFKERGQVDTKDFEAKKQGLKNILVSIKKREHINTWLENHKTALIKDGKLKLIKDIKDI